MTQTIIALAIVCLAAIFLTRKIIRFFSGKEKGCSCESCSQCTNCNCQQKKK
ncbi:MAG: FeoB-associated Cys-rich membrane protein [Bacteroidales bacterium]|nr:FeoB-associated Cys-rich membrane protein [Candidatus Scybalousia scybalohippi]